MFMTEIMFMAAIPLMRRIQVLAGKKNDTLENGTKAPKAIMDNRYISKGIGCCNEVGGKKNCYDRWYGKGIWNDPSQYVHDACIYYNK